METLWQDLRFGLRMSLKHPGFIAAVVLALALGIGANTVIFSVVNAILLNPLPYPHPDRLVMVWLDNKRLGLDQDWHSYPNYADYRDQNKVFEKLAAFNDRRFNLTGEGEPERIIGAWATANFFAVMGVEPVMGRAFTVEEEEPGRDQVVVIGYGLWQRRFGSDPKIVGQTISLNGAPRTVVGVMPAHFRFPSKEAEMWVPLALSANGKNARGGFSLKSIGRLKPGITITQARADLGTIASRLEQQYPDMLSGYGVNLVPLYEQVVGKIRPALLVLLGAVGFVLLIACANVANLLLARAAVREREIAVRMALGAGRARLIRQLLTESALLAVLGGAAGLLIAEWGLKVLLALSPADIPRLDQIKIDGRVLAFTLAVSLLTGLIFGLAPALQSSKLDLNESLKEGGRSATGGLRGRRIRGVLVVAEVALSLVLLIGAGLMIKSFLRLQQVNLGFNPDRLLTMRVDLAGSKYREGPKAVAFYQQLLGRVATLPGVQAVGAISDIFLSSTPNSANFSIEGRPEVPPAQRIETPIDQVSANYFQVMGTPLLKGRLFDEHDANEAPRVAIINDTFARRFFPDEDPLGKRFKFGGVNSQAPWMTIVGVVADVRRTGFDAEVRCETFLPLAQSPSRSMTLVLRTAADPLSLAKSARAAVWAIDKDQPVYSLRTMEQLLREMIAQRRLNMLLLGIFSVISLVLAAVGIYAIISYSVTERTHEIGIRLTLGAERRDILRLVVGQGMLLALLGVAIGLAAAFALTRLMSSLLYGVSATDPVTFGGISLLLVLIALVASYIPARRAMRVDPMVALRYE